MKIAIEPGRYIVAVSGGVDSVVLLHLLQSRPNLKLTVAHFDHGIRADSAQDKIFVKQLAHIYNLPFVYARGNLGPDASEAVARQARYDFLHSARSAARADAVVTAHHQDDVLETAILNIIRGTGRRGLTSLKSTDIMKRPLLHVPKTDIVDYARSHQLQWREDSTNTDDTYRRNHVRHNVLPRYDAAERARLHEIVRSLHPVNAKIDQFVTDILAAYMTDGVMDRRRFILLPHAVAREVMAGWLRSARCGEIDRKLLEQLVWAAKTFKPSQRLSINHNYYLLVGKNDLALVRAER